MKQLLPVFFIATSVGLAAIALTPNKMFMEQDARMESPSSDEIKTKAAASREADRLDQKQTKVEENKKYKNKKKNLMIDKIDRNERND